MQKYILMTNNGETEEVKIYFKLYIHDKYMKQKFIHGISIDERYFNCQYLS